MLTFVLLQNSTPSFTHTRGALRWVQLDEVKVGIIQHLAAFLATLSEATRANYLPTLVEIRAETDNWRFRCMLASQARRARTLAAPCGCGCP